MSTRWVGARSSQAKPSPALARCEMRDATNERAGRRMTVYVSTIPPSTSDLTQLAEVEEKEEAERRRWRRRRRGEEVTHGGYAER